MILKKHKNALLTIIQESGLDPMLFTAADGTIADESFLIIQLRNSPICFAVRPWDKFDDFGYRLSLFLPGFPLGGTNYTSHSETLYSSFKGWLDSIVKSYLDEASTPDLWQALQENLSEPVGQLESPLDLEPFSEIEKIQIKRSIDGLRLSIENKFNLQNKQLSTTNKLLQHLSDAVDKHSRFDWRGIAINVAATIATHLALNPEQSSQLFALFTAAFSNTINLLP